MSESMRVRIRVGEVEIEIEGSESFIDGQIQPALDSAMALSETAVTSTKIDKNGQKTSDIGGNGDYVGTLQTWAAKLGVKTGPELIVAALGRKQLVEGAGTTSRPLLIKEMQSAPQYYKASYVSNLTTNLKSLIRADRVREISHEVYALSAAELERVRASYDS